MLLDGWNQIFYFLKLSKFNLKFLLPEKTIQIEELKSFVKDDPTRLYRAKKPTENKFEAILEKLVMMIKYHCITLLEKEKSLLMNLNIKK